MRVSGLSLTIISSIVVFSIAYISITLGEIHIHMSYMLLSLIVFAHAVTVAYVASVGKIDKRLSNFISPLILLGILSKYLIAIPSMIMMYLAIKASKKNTGSMKISLMGVSFSYLLLLLWSFTQTDPIDSAILGLAFPLALIYSVSTHSLPKTFGDDPRASFFYLSLALVGLGTIDHRAYLISLAPYFIGAKYDRLTKYCDKARSVKGVAGKALFYYCCGHILVLLSSVIPLMAQNTLFFLHSMLLGFITMNVFVHTPTMLPPIMGMRNARRYNCLPFALALLASIVWPYYKDFSWVLYSLGVISNALTFLPLKMSR